VTVLDELIGSLMGIPALPGARCKGRSDIWESDCPELVEYAINQCRTCPSLQPCRQFVESLPRRQQPSGVTGGVCRRPLKPRKSRRETAAA
jgi:hypothetical protein